MTWIPPGPFGPISIQTQLNGAGNGNVSFQANGRNARLTRVVVAVATSVKQASVAVYKGQIGTSNFLGTIVSGSTGGLASGQIDLTDGQTVYVVWTGGDANAIATATFSGNAIQLSDIGNDSITWTDPIAASDGSLIFPAIKSANYLAGISGWQIDRLGSAEFNNIINRGSFFAGVANGPNGAVAIEAIPGFGGDINIYPLPSNVAGVTWFPANIGAGRDEVSVSPVTTKPYLQITSPGVTTPVNQHSAVLLLRGESSAATNDDSNFFFQAQSVSWQTTSSGTAGDGGYGWVAGADTTVNLPGVIGSAQVVQLTAVTQGGFLPQFAPGRAYRVDINLNVETTLVSAAPVVEVRKASAAGQRFGSWRIGPTVANFPYGFSASCYFIVGPTAVVSNVICLSLGGAAGQTVKIDALADNPTRIDVYDVGTALSFPNAPVIT